MATTWSGRRVGIALGAFAGVVVLSLTAGYAVLQTSWARARVASAIGDALSGDGIEVEVGSLDGPLPGAFTLHDVVASDAAGVWARIGAVKVQWRPWRLLFDSLDVQTLDVRDANLVRLPKRAASREAAGRGGHAAFVGLPDRGIAVDSFSVEAEIGPALTSGTSEPFRAHGSLRSGMGGGGHLSLDATQGAPGDSRLRARVRVDPDARTLDLALRAHEAPGGLVSRLLGLPHAEPFDVTVTGGGPLASWKGVARASLGAHSRLDARIATSGNMSTPRVSIQGTAVTPPLLGGRWEAAAAPPYAFDLEFSVAGRRLRFTDTTLKTAAASAAVAGTLDLSDGSMDVTLRLRSLDAAARASLVEPLSAPSLAFQARVRGRWSAPHVEVSATVPSVRGRGLRAGPSRLAAKLDFDTGGPGVGFRFHASGELTKLAWTEGRAARPSDVRLDAEGVYRAAAERLSVATLSVRSDWASADFDGDVDLSPGASARVSGRVQAELRGWPTRDPVLARLLEQPAKFQSSIVYRTQGERLRLADLRLEHPQLSVRGDLEVGFRPARVHGNLQGRITDVAPLSEWLGVGVAGGPIAFDLRTPLNGASARSTLTATAARLMISGTQVHAVEATLAFYGSEAQRGRLDLAFTGPGGPVTASSRVARLRSPSRVAFRDVRVAAAGGTLQGSLVVPLAGGAVTGGVAGRFGSLKAVSAWLGHPVQGAARLSVRFADEGGRQGATGRLDAKEVSFGGATLDTISFRCTTDFRRAEFQVAARGAYRGRLSLDAAGSADWSTPVRTFVVRTLSATHAKTRVRLLEPASFVLSQDRTALSPTRLRIGDGRAELEGSRASGSIHARVSLSDLSFSVLRAFTHASPGAGTLSGTADLEADAQRQSGNAAFRITGLAMSPGANGAESLDGTVSVRWRGSDLDLEARLTGSRKTRIALTASAPLRFAARTGTLRLPADGPLRGRLVWNADVGPLWSAFGPDTQQLEGRVEASLALAGTVSDPFATGDLALRDGRYTNLETGTVLDDLTARLAADRRRIRLIEANATDGGSGKVTASGSIGLDRKGDFPIELEIRADRATLVRRTEVTATASGKLTFTRRDGVSRIEGKLRTDGVEAILVDLSSPDVVDLHVTEIGPDGSILPPPGARTSSVSPQAIRLDVSVDVPGRAFIRGRGLDSEWKGKLRVTGTAAQPELVGTFDVVRGNFQFAGRTFTLQQGQVAFRGGNKVDPELNIEAVYDVEGLTATVRVTGRSSAPKVALSSTPPLPQDEILARILFGSKVANLTPLQALQLADAVRNLGEPSGGWLGSIRAAIGLDVLQVGAGSGSGLEAATITGGKYIGKNIYVQVETSPTGGQESVGVDYGLTKDLSIESQVGPTVGSRLGLKWKHDY